MPWLALWRMPKVSPSQPRFALQAHLCLRQRVRRLRRDSCVEARPAKHGLPLQQVQRRLPLHCWRPRRVLVRVPLRRDAYILPQPKAAARAAQAAATLPHAGQGVVHPCRGAAGRKGPSWWRHSTALASSGGLSRLLAAPRTAKEPPSRSGPSARLRRGREARPTSFRFCGSSDSQAEPIMQGEFVIEYVGELISSAEVSNLIT